MLVEIGMFTYVELIIADEDGGRLLLRNVGMLLNVDTTSQPTSVKFLLNVGLQEYATS